MTLLEILVRELPKRGGWPGDAVAISVSSAMAVYAHERMPTRIISGVWTDENEDTFGKYGRIFFLDESQDYREKPVTREQYEAVLSADKAEWDGNGTPPAGSCFEYQSSQGHWERAKMIFCGKEFAIIDLEGFGESWLRLTGTIFRVARSEEDKRRDEAVEEFVRSIIECVDLHSMHKRQDVIVREKVYSLLPSLPGVTVNDLAAR
ncbi:TPA: hypothetical protein LVM22_002005 [Klebsiella oxytoca]|nr:hypothetical protein [Klebsiella oxytoca]